MTDRARLFLPEARGLKREQAAHYVGVKPSQFDIMVKEGRMPKPKHEGSRRIWDRFGLDLAFEKLPSAEEVNPWDEDRS